MRTVEIKAKIKNYNDLITKIYRIIHRAYVIKSIDTFYVTNNGKLMLREFEEFAYGSLVSYKRSDEEGLQVCTSYGSLLCHKLELLGSMLFLSNGIIGTVKKKRQAYYIDDVQINIDNVDTLGDFVEIKVTDKDIEPAKEIVNDLMQKLSITKPKTSRTFEKPGTSKITETFDMFNSYKMFDTSDMSDVSGTPIMLESPEPPENLEMFEMPLNLTKEKKVQVPSQLQMSETSKTSETFKIPGTSKITEISDMLGTLTTSKEEMFKTIKHLLMNKEREIEISSQLQMSEKPLTLKSCEIPEKPRTLRSFEVPGTSKVTETETSDTLETLTSAMSETSEKHLPM